jgi:hypothetical protein
MQRTRKRTSAILALTALTLTACGSSGSGGSGSGSGGSQDPILIGEVAGTTGRALIDAYLG